MKKIIFTLLISCVLCGSVYADTSYKGKNIVSLNTSITDLLAGAGESLKQPSRDIPASQSEMLGLINSVRKEKGLNELKYSTALSDTAQQYAEYMSANNYFNHTSQSGQTSTDRITAADSALMKWSENIARNFNSTSDVVDSWMKSEKHRANLLDPDAEVVGIGFSGGYWVADFGAY